MKYVDIEAKRFLEHQLRDTGILTMPHKNNNLKIKYKWVDVFVYASAVYAQYLPV